MEKKILMGNEAIGRGLFESACELFSSYPGTPASEILKSVSYFNNQVDGNMHIEWSVNEKIAYEVALASSYTGKRSAVAMKQVGLNVASDAFMRSAYLGVKGGFVLIVADDPGPHSSQTEQDSRFFANFAKIPVFDPSSPLEAKEMIKEAFLLSEKFKIPVMLRTTTRVCHSRQNIDFSKPVSLKHDANFKKDPARWVATPKFLTILHEKLNKKIDEISKEFYPTCVKGNNAKKCIISSGIVYMHIYEILENLNKLSEVDFYKVNLPYPLNAKFIDDIRQNYDDILVVEETYPTIENQLLNPKIKGRISKDIPNHGELTPKVIEEILFKFLSLPINKEIENPAKEDRPTLCAGCPHRAAFYSIKRCFPNGIFPSDIGCYTLGMNLGAVDTCHCMGACISFGAGFYHSYKDKKEDAPPIVVTIGDSTFFHSGIPALINAVITDARIIIVILDNSTTAMTGNQPTAETGGTVLSGKNSDKKVYIKDIVKASGVNFLKECDPYNIQEFLRILKEADQFCKKDDGGLAVIISKHPCILDKKNKDKQKVVDVSISDDDCIGCKICLEEFECPALIFDEDNQKAAIDDKICIRCGVCCEVCPSGAILLN